MCPRNSRTYGPPARVAGVPAGTGVATGPVPAAAEARAEAAQGQGEELSDVSPELRVAVVSVGIRIHRVVIHRPSLTNHAAKAVPAGVRAAGTITQIQAAVNCRVGDLGDCARAQVRVCGIGRLVFLVGHAAEAAEFVVHAVRAVIMIGDHAAASCKSLSRKVLRNTWVASPGKSLTHASAVLQPAMRPTKTGPKSILAFTRPP